VRRSGMVFCILLCVLGTHLYVGVASAEIYKWVDEEGNIHFGDKPLDPEKAESAEPVELQESYIPASRTAAEQATYDAQQQASRRRYEATRLADKEAREAAAAEEEERTSLICAELAESLSRLSSTQIGPGGRLVRQYIAEDGKSVTVQRQREIIEEIKNEMGAAGCSN